MSKKEYDFYVSKRNTPHLDLYTKLISMFYFFVGTNFGLAALYSRVTEKRQSIVGCLLVLSLLMYSLIPVKARSLMRENRGVLAVVLGGVVCTICTFYVMCVLSFWLLIIVYIVEMISVLIVILNYFNLHKDR